MEELEIRILFDLTKSLAGDYLKGFTYPWEALSGIGEMIVALGKTLPEAEYNKCGENIWVAKDATVAPSACINGPAIIGRGAEVRHCAYIRGNALVGANAVVGNSTELKNVILFDGVQVPHYNYVGDSILGYKSHMGAGSITSNVKADKSFVFIHAEEAEIETGLKKMGAILGDNVEIGCGAVLNPGTIICRQSTVYPLSSVRGVVGPGSIYKKAGDIAGKAVPLV